MPSVGSSKNIGRPASASVWALSEEERLWLVLSSLLIDAPALSKALKVLGFIDIIEALEVRQQEYPAPVWTPRVTVPQQCAACDGLRYSAIGVVWARGLSYDGMTPLPNSVSTCPLHGGYRPSDSDNSMQPSDLPGEFDYIPLGARCRVWQDLLNRFTNDLQECASYCLGESLCQSGSYDVHSGRCQLSSESCQSRIVCDKSEFSSVALVATRKKVKSWECPAPSRGWCRVSYRATDWSPRAGHSLVVVEGHLFLIGGHGVVNNTFTNSYMSREVGLNGRHGSVVLRDIPLGRLADVWLYNDSIEHWQSLPVEGHVDASSYHQAVSQGDTVEIFGGLTDFDRPVSTKCVLKDNGSVDCIANRVPDRVAKRYCHGSIELSSGIVTILSGRSWDGILLRDAWTRNSEGYWEEEKIELPFEGCISSATVMDRVAVLAVDSGLFCTSESSLTRWSCSPIPFRSIHTKPTLVSLEEAYWIAVVGLDGIYLADLSASYPKWYKSPTFPKGVRLAAGAAVYEGNLWVTGGVTREGYFDLSTWTIGTRKLVDSAVEHSPMYRPTSRPSTFIQRLYDTLNEVLPWVPLVAPLVLPLATGKLLECLQIAITIAVIERYIRGQLENATSDSQQIPDTVLRAIHEAQVYSALSAGVVNLPTISEPLGASTSADLLCRTPPCSRVGECNKSYRERLGDGISDAAPNLGTLCCSDLLHQILRDVLEVIDSLGVSYMAMYGTLLGAVRGNDHLPHTRDVDLVVVSNDWARIAEELSRRTFGGGRRRYIAAVDQWDSKVLRICADYSGWDPVWFSSDERDDSRDFVSVHLDLYDEDWWAVRDLKLMGCMVPHKTSGQDEPISIVCSRRRSITRLCLELVSRDIVAELMQSTCCQGFLCFRLESGNVSYMECIIVSYPAPEEPLLPPSSLAPAMIIVLHVDGEREAGRPQPPLWRTALDKAPYLGLVVICIWCVRLNCRATRLANYARDIAIKRMGEPENMSKSAPSDMRERFVIALPRRMSRRSSRAMCDFCRMIAYLSTAAVRRGENA
ncbi:hypothetical protein FOZ63_003851 [Perkinsus olseni]|uniref:Uncharacterized protein n=1 Tax=Perkinsus olseni TaxID=32597 RepID=A0A7J6TGM4_PEROL|nr:hypothetical protein FOZ63_003851 [Perkinsus olseni]